VNDAAPGLREPAKITASDFLEIRSDSLGRYATKDAAISAGTLRGRAAELRLAFDRGFAEPMRRDTAAKTALLAIRIAGERCALRLAEITGLSADKAITRLPANDAALIGVAGFRGAIVPVYSLQALLGHSPAQAPRWLAIAAGTPIAFAFEVLEGQLNVAPDTILPAPMRADARACVRDFVRTQNFSGPVLHIPSLLDAIKARRGETAPRKGAMT
jgi:chemotaxis signal transduction protein